MEKFLELVSEVIEADIREIIAQHLEDQANAKA